MHPGFEFVMATTSINRIIIIPARSGDVLGCLAACAFVLGAVGFTLALGLWLICTFERINLDTLETVLLIASFGLVVAGAHCMDRIGERKRSDWE